jgi:dihydropteroate synthase
MNAWPVGERTVALDPFALVGILNVTPDSFSDGGLDDAPEASAARALAMVAEGAAMIDVGGESTRPGARRVPADEQIRRVLPVIRAIRAASSVPISIDTTLREVAAAALEAGADAINDVAAGTEDPGIFALAADRGAGLVLMHRVAPPDRDRYSTEHAHPPLDGDIVAAVRAWLIARVELATGAGVPAERIALDPGLGFGKSVTQNWQLIARSGELADLGHPLLVGASRKSFVGAVTGVTEPARRVIGSVVAAVIAWSGGARLIRTHDVGATAEGLRAGLAAISSGRDSAQA